jgi:outer membrane receptor protein involved in Fe transport
VYASAKYSGEFSGKLFSIIGDINFRDDTNTEFRADSPFNIQLDSFVVANIYGTIDINESLSIGAYVKNLTDELAVYDGIGTFQDPESIVANRPRTIGLTLQLNF